MRCTKDNGKITRDMEMVKLGTLTVTCTTEASRMIKGVARAVLISAVVVIMKVAGKTMCIMAMES